MNMGVSVQLTIDDRWGPEFESLVYFADALTTFIAQNLVAGRRRDFSSYCLLVEFVRSHIVMNRSNNNNRRVYVGNLPSNIDERDLEDVFYKYGDISDVDLKIPRYGTGGTPFAFVEFHDPRYVGGVFKKTLSENLRIIHGNIMA